MGKHTFSMRKLGVGIAVLAPVFALLLAPILRAAGTTSDLDSRSAEFSDTRLRKTHATGIEEKTTLASDRAVAPRARILGSGGPDAFGYSYIDSDELDGPTFDWVDISGTGTPVFTGVGAALDNQVAGPFTIPFSFPFYGNFFTKFYVDTNGWVSFTDPAGVSDPANKSLPSAAAPDNLLAAFWEDLRVFPDFSTPSNVFWDYDGTRVIIQYDAVTPYSLDGINILWDRSNGQFSPSTWSTIIADFTARGATVTENTDPITPALLANYDVFWSIDNVSPAWDAAEITAIVNWVLAGGAVILSADQSVPEMNALLTALGAGFTYSTTNGTAGATSNVYPHPTTENVATVYLGNPLAIVPSVAPNAVLLVEDSAGVGAAAAEEIGAGRVFAVADEVFFNGDVNTNDNRLFGNQVMNWLVGNDGPYTFEIFLYPNGTIVYQYLSMGDPTDGATVGIQNEPGDIGLEVAHNQAYVKDNLAVQFTAHTIDLAGPLDPAGAALPGDKLTCAQDCGRINVYFNAAGQTIQGYALMFQLGNGIQLCDASPGTQNWRQSIGNGTWSGGIPTVKTLTDLGGGLYQVVESTTGSCPTLDAAPNNADNLAFTISVKGMMAGTYTGNVDVVFAQVFSPCGTTTDLAPTLPAALPVTVERPLPDITAIDTDAGVAGIDWHAWQSRTESNEPLRIQSLCPGVDCSAASDASNLACPQCGTNDVILEFQNPRDNPAFGVDGECWRVEIYRARFGNYPWYDDPIGPPGNIPPAPLGYPPPSRWTLVAQDASSPFLDDTDVGGLGTGGGTRLSQRDEWFYVAYLVDEYGNASLPAPVVSTLNYHLGDLTRRVFIPAFPTPTTEHLKGDNLVDIFDVTFLSFCYGIPQPFPRVHPTTGLESCNVCDIGPTVTGTVVASRFPPVFGGRSVAKAHRPSVDGVIDINDLIIVTTNAFKVSKPQDPPPLAAVDALSVDAPASVEPGQEFAATVLAQGAGNVQAMSITLTWDASVVEPVEVGGRSNVRAGELLTLQEGIALSPWPGTVDVALLGKREVGLAGEGELATMRFRAVGEGDPLIEIGSIDARGPDNQSLSLSTGRVSTTPSATPQVTELYSGVPNPFNPSTMIAFSLAQAGQVELSIYSVSGRRVKTLFQGSRDAGMYEAQWDGRDEMGRAVPSGIYYARLTTANVTQTKSLALLK